LGRLGNNLFQYALGRVLAEKHGVPLVMDGSWYNREGWAQVRHLRDLPGPSSGKVRVTRCCSIASRVLLKSSGRHRWEYSRIPVIREKEDDQSFKPAILNTPADATLFGYFQCPLYFKGMEEPLRSELSTTDLRLEKGNEALVDKLGREGATAVHVRRTDYVGNPNLDICDAAYYQRAMDFIRQAVPDSQFYIFSDDPSWCSSQFLGSDIEIVTARSHSPLTGLHLMSLARHHIIANSSYSWWAAWLGKKEGQHVLMPSRWFGEINAPIEEKRCEGWTII
jgi:hypothetical protein